MTSAGYAKGACGTAARDFRERVGKDRKENEKNEKKRTWFGVVMTDDFDVSPIARASRVCNIYAVEWQVAVPETGESDSHNHFALECARGDGRFIYIYIL